MRRVDKNDYVQVAALLWSDIQTKESGVEGVSQVSDTPKKSILLVDKNI